VLESSHPKESQRRRAARRRSLAQPSSLQQPSPPQPPSSPQKNRGRADAASNRLRSQPPSTPQRISTQRYPLNNSDSGNTALPAQRGKTDRSDVNGQRKPREKRDRRPTPPLLHLIRLLILGVGVGAIAGTVLSIWNPAMHPSALTTQRINSAALGGGSGGGNGLGRSSAAILLAKGQELTGLTPKVLPMAQEDKDLLPGAFLVDLDTGDYFSLNGASGFSAASMIKVPILIALLQDVDTGRVRLDEKLILQQADIGEGSGEMQYSPIGSDYTVLQTITDMIVISDNTATNMVIRRLGGIEVLNQRFRQWGLLQTNMRQLLPDLEGTNITSPKELSMLLAMLSQGELLSMKSRDRALNIMQQTVTDTLLPTSLGEGSTISHKTGDIGSLVGDTGIIDMPNGKRYALTLMVKRPHNDSRAQELIRQMAATVYDYLNQAVGGRSGAAPTEATAPENPVDAVNSDAIDSESGADSGNVTPDSANPDSANPDSPIPNNGAMMTQPAPTAP
jgi:beta-lactamase class A